MNIPDDDVTQIISYRPANTDALWQEVVDAYLTLNSVAVTDFAHSRLSAADLNNFLVGRDHYGIFVAGLAVSIQKKMPAPTRSLLLRHVRTTSNVSELLQRKLKVLDNLIVKRTLTLSVSGILHTLSTQSAFSKAQKNFAKAKARFDRCKWILTESDGAVDINRLPDRALSALLGRLSVTGIKELVLPQLTSANAQRVLNLLADFPAKAYHRALLPRIVNMFLSDYLHIPSYDVGANNPRGYWAGVPRSKVSRLLSSMDNSSLAKIAPFLNLTIREIESLDLYFDSRSIRYMGMSRFPVVRAYWVASRVSNVLPALFIYNRRGYAMSSAERNLIGIYNGQLALAEASLRNTRVPAGWRWFAWPNVPADLISDWRQFERQAAPHAESLDLKPLGAYLKAGSTLALMVYRTIYGDLESSRQEDACLSTYAYCHGRRSSANPDPRKDTPVALNRWQTSATEALSLATNLELSQQKG